MSALPKSKKKKILIILSQLAPMAKSALVDNDTEGSAAEVITDQLGQARAVLFEYAEDDWNADQHYAWTVIESIYAAFSPEAVSVPTEQILQSLSGDLAAALERC